MTHPEKGQIGPGADPVHDRPGEYFARELFEDLSDREEYTYGEDSTQHDVDTSTPVWQRRAQQEALPAPIPVLDDEHDENPPSEPRSNRVSSHEASPVGSVGDDVPPEEDIMDAAISMMDEMHHPTDGSAPINIPMISEQHQLIWRQKLQLRQIFQCCTEALHTLILEFNKSVS